MRVTEPAVDAILEVMRKKGLSPKTTFLEIGIFEGNLGLGFTKDRHGKIITYKNLSIVIANDVDTTGVVVDFKEIKGRKGLIFTGESDDNTNYSDTKSNSGN